MFGSLGSFLVNTKDVFRATSVALCCVDGFTYTRSLNAWESATVHVKALRLRQPESVTSRLEFSEEDDIIDIDVFYNRQRKHESLGYRSPAQFESAIKCA